MTRKKSLSRKKNYKGRRERAPCEGGVASKAFPTGRRVEVLGKKEQED